MMSAMKHALGIRGLLPLALSFCMGQASASAASEDVQDHWAFKAPMRPSVPAVRNRKWVRNPIDSFVLARLEKEGLRPSAEAERATLIPRLSLELPGWPPHTVEMAP